MVAHLAHLARQADPAIPMVWFDSGLEWPETRAYLADLADAWDLNLAVVHPRPDALEVMEASGAWHLDRPRQQVPSLSQVCIDIPAATAHERYGPGELWGVRADEAGGRRAMYATALRREIERSCAGCCASARERAAAHGGVVRRGDGTTAYGPIWDWATSSVFEYVAAHEIPLNPVYAKLRRLGGAGGLLAGLARRGRLPVGSGVHDVAAGRVAAAVGGTRGPAAATG